MTSVDQTALDKAMKEFSLERGRYRQKLIALAVECCASGIDLYPKMFELAASESEHKPHFASLYAQENAAWSSGQEHQRRIESNSTSLLDETASPKSQRHFVHASEVTWRYVQTPVATVSALIAYLQIVNGVSLLVIAPFAAVAIVIPCMIWRERRYRDRFRRNLMSFGGCLIGLPVLSWLPSIENLDLNFNASAWSSTAISLIATCQATTQKIHWLERSIAMITGAVLIVVGFFGKPEDE